MAFSWKNKPNRFDDLTKSSIDEIRTNINTLEGFLNCSSKQTVVHGGNYGSFAPSENAGVFNTFNTNYCETVCSEQVSSFCPSNYKSHQDGHYPGFFSEEHATVFSNDNTQHNSSAVQTVRSGVHNTVQAKHCTTVFDGN